MRCPQTNALSRPLDPREKRPPVARLQGGPCVPALGVSILWFSHLSGFEQSGMPLGATLQPGWHTLPVPDKIVSNPLRASCELDSGSMSRDHGHSKHLVDHARISPRSPKVAQSGADRSRSNRPAWCWLVRPGADQLLFIR